MKQLSDNMVSNDDGLLRLLACVYMVLFFRALRDTPREYLTGDDQVGSLLRADPTDRVNPGK